MEDERLDLEAAIAQAKRVLKYVEKEVSEAEDIERLKIIVEKMDKSGLSPEERLMLRGLSDSEFRLICESNCCAVLFCCFVCWSFPVFFLSISSLYGSCMSYIPHTGAEDMQIRVQGKNHDVHVILMTHALIVCVARDDRLLVKVLLHWLPHPRVWCADMCM